MRSCEELLERRVRDPSRVSRRLFPTRLTSPCLWVQDRVPGPWALELLFLLFRGSEKCRIRKLGSDSFGKGPLKPFYARYDPLNGGGALLARWQERRGSQEHAALAPDRLKGSKEGWCSALAPALPFLAW